MNDDRQFTVTFTYRPSSGGTTTMVRTFVISSNQWFVVAKSETGNLLVQVRSTDSSSGLQIGEGADALLDGTVYSSTYLTSIRFDTINTIYRQTGTYPWLSTAYDYANLLYIKPLRVNGYTYLQTLAGFDEWFKANSTSSSIVKILQLPYCPIEFEDTGTALVFEDDSYDPDDYGLVISPSVVTAMTHEIVSERPALTTLTKDEVDVTLARSQTTKDETKLLNSSYGPYTTYSYDASS